MENQASIKKLNLTYAKCPHGDLHSGEVMNLICVDSNCGRRGIICPICRMKNHEDHEILPLKVFLQQIKKLFLQSDDSSALNNLSDYLRSIQSSKKQMINILRDAAESIAQEFKAIEAKLNENYTNIRRNILTQSSISTKLPNLVNLLTESAQKDAIALQQQFHKYSELLKYENSKMNVCDKAKKLVQQYSLKPNSIKISLDQQVKTIHQKFNEIFFNKAVPAKDVSEKYTFSTQNKSYEITVGDNNKIVSTNDDLQNLGFAYIKEGVGQLKRKITFQVSKLSSQAVILGMGFPQNDQAFAYVFNSIVKNKHFASQCAGYNNTQEEDGEQQYQPDNFKFNAGSQVTVEFDGDKNKIVFSKKDDKTTKQISLSLSTEEKKKLQFFVVLAESDEVKIVDN